MGGRLAQERLRVRRRADVDVAALGVGDHEQPGVVRALDHLSERGPAGRAEALEARDLRLHRDAVLGDRIDRQRTVRRDRERRPRRRWLTDAAGEFDRARPQVCRIRIQPEHDLGGALGDPAR